MKKLFRKAISVLLVAVMVLCAAPLAGFVGIDLPSIADIFSVKAKAEEVITGTYGYYTYSVYNGEASITDVSEEIIGNVVIPSNFDGYPVTAISFDAFYFCSAITGVVIPDTVTHIWSGAFEKCTNLKSVTIPISVTYISVSAFAECGELERTNYQGTPEQWAAIEIYNNNWYLEERLVFECNSSRPYYGKGDCGDNLTWIHYTDGELVISGNGAIRNYEYTSDVPWFKNRSKITSVKFPDGLTRIGDYAFYDCNSILNITIPEGVTSIGEQAFYYCQNLTSITIPKSVIYIGDYAFDLIFYYDPKLKDVYYGGTKAEWEQIVIGNGNEDLTSATIHYNYVENGNDGSTEKPDISDTPQYDDYVVDKTLVGTPTETTINYGDTIILHMDAAKIPKGGKVEWYASNNNFSYTVTGNGYSCIITPSSKGDTTFTAIVYDANGNIVSADEQVMTSKAGFFDKIIAFFKKLFGLTKTIPQIYKGIY